MTGQAASVDWDSLVGEPVSGSASAPTVSPQSPGGNFVHHNWDDLVGEPVQATPAPVQQGGIPPNVIAGAAGGIAGTQDMLKGAQTALTSGVQSPPPQAADAGFQRFLAGKLAGRGGSATGQLEAGSSPLGSLTQGVHPSQVSSNSLLERAARAFGGAAATAPLFGFSGAGAGVGTVGRSLINPAMQIGKAGLAGAAGQVGGEALAGVAPESMKPAAELAGNVAGSMFGANAPSAARGMLNAGIRGALVPSAAREPGLLPMLQNAQAQGYTPTVGQVTNSPFAKAAEKMTRVIPGSGYGPADDAYQGFINQRANQVMGLNPSMLERMGLPTDKVTDAHYNLANEINGGAMNAIERTGAVQFDQPLMNRLADIHDSANSGLEASKRQVVQGAIDKIWNFGVDRNNIPQTYANQPNTVPYDYLHKGAGVDALLSNTDPNIRSYAGQISSAMKDALHRSLPDDATRAMYLHARIGYANMKALEPMSGRADVVSGPHVSTGDIIPEQLRGLANRMMGSQRVARSEPGEYELNDLADLAQRLKQNRTSMTGEHEMAGAVIKHGAETAGHLGVAALGIGGAAAHAAGAGGIVGAAAPLAVAGALGGMGVARGVGSALRTPALPTSTIGEGLAQNMPAAAAGVAGDQQQPQEMVVTPQGASMQPVTNPQTGQQQFNLADAQDEAKNPVTEGLLSSGAKYRDWANKNHSDIYSKYGGQATIRAHQIGAALNRGPTVAKRIVDELNDGSGSFHDAAKSVGIDSAHQLIHAALKKPGLIGALTAEHHPGPANGLLAKTIAKAMG